MINKDDNKILHEVNNKTEMNAKRDANDERV